MPLVKQDWSKLVNDIEHAAIQFPELSAAVWCSDPLRVRLLHLMNDGGLPLPGLRLLSGSSLIPAHRHCRIFDVPPDIAKQSGISLDAIPPDLAGLVKPVPHQARGWAFEVLAPAGMPDRLRAEATLGDIAARVTDGATGGQHLPRPDKVDPLPFLLAAIAESSEVRWTMDTLGQHRVWATITPDGRKSLKENDPPASWWCVTLPGVFRSVAAWTAQRDGRTKKPPPRSDSRAAPAPIVDFKSATRTIVSDAVKADVIRAFRPGKQYDQGMVRKAMTEYTDFSPARGTVVRALSALAEEGKLIRVSRGWYKLPA